MDIKPGVTDSLQRWDAFNEVERWTLLDALGLYIEHERKADFGDAEVYRTALRLYRHLDQLRRDQACRGGGRSTNGTL